MEPFCRVVEGNHCVGRFGFVDFCLLVCIPGMVTTCANSEPLSSDVSSILTKQRRGRSGKWGRCCELIRKECANEDALLNKGRMENPWKAVGERSGRGLWGRTGLKIGFAGE